MSVPKKYRDEAMALLINYEKNREPGQFKPMEYLSYPDALKNIDPKEMFLYLSSKGLVEYNEENGLRVTDLGMTYFEDEADAFAIRKEGYRHNWKVAVFSAFAGALLARPLWACLDDLWFLLLNLLVS